MNIHEFQAKQLLKQFGAPVSNGVVIFSPFDTGTTKTIRSTCIEW